jgi:hypothetical protein
VSGLDGSGEANGVRGGVTEPAHVGDERTTLLGFLQRQRDLVAWKVSEASDETLASVRMPTGLTLHGIVLHLTNVERSWFREFFAGETGLDFDSSEENPDGDFRAEGVPMTDLLAAYAAETARCDEVIATAPHARRDGDELGRQVYVFPTLGHRSHDRGDGPTSRPHGPPARARRRSGWRGPTFDLMYL